ncbi:universal stress protein [Jiella sonneratiae]|uniref:Universal stress protein n=1 Tax=Jiella sonneratiae TaxID=2816856 RepID=A0ABS3J507_9HYPH|nr:universal stress protein [Jiella sonneratiae]MBO0904028.1 universal stress protein [Jiella sonneratiae]
MTKIVACIDGSLYAESVCDHAAWAAGRLGLAVDLVHALGRRETASQPFDLSGTLDLGEREALLAELADLDEKKSKVAARRGRLVLAQAAERLNRAGVAVEQHLRHGDVADAVSAMETEARLVVIGKRGEAADFARGHLGSNLERVIRSTPLPVLVASRAFREIRRFMVAFDGGRSAMAIVERLAASPLLAETSCELFMAGEPSGEAGERLHLAERRLREAGYAASVRIAEGDADEVIARRVEAGGIDLIVMGAYGHSRIRHLIVGSTTTRLIQSCAIPVLVVR